jgi:hypothetical protein
MTYKMKPLNATSMLALKATPQVSLCGVDKKDADERYAHISRVRKRFDYPHRKKTCVGWYWPTCSALAATTAPRSNDW